VFACILIAKPRSWMAHIIIRHQGTPLLFSLHEEKKKKGKKISRVGIRDRSKGLLSCAGGRSASRRQAVRHSLHLKHSLSYHVCFEAEKLGIGNVREACLTTWRDEFRCWEPDRRCFADPARSIDGMMATRQSDGLSASLFVCGETEGDLNRAIA